MPRSDVGNKGVRRIDGIKPVSDIAQVGVEFVVNNKPPLFQGFNLLSEGKGLLGISHKGINKKCPALVRYIPCGREAAAGSIVCKGTKLFHSLQAFCDF